MRLLREPRQIQRERDSDSLVFFLEYFEEQRESSSSICLCLLANIPSGGSIVDLTVTGNSNYRPLTLTEKIFTDEWSKKLSSKNQSRKESNTSSQQQGLFAKEVFSDGQAMFVENNHPNHTLQFRPAIPRRPSPGRLPASHNLLLTSQIHNHQETKLPTHLTESDLEHEERIDNAIKSHSLSNHSVEQSKPEVITIADLDQLLVLSLSRLH